MSSSKIFAMVARTSNKRVYRTVGAHYVPVYIEQDRDEYLHG
jgi:hypothetical protein